MKRRWIRVAIAAAVLSPLAVIGLLYFLSASQPGLQLLLRLGSSFSRGRLVFEQASGVLGGSMRLRGLRYIDAGTEVSIKELAIDWSPKKLLQRKASIRNLFLDEVVVRSAPSQAASEEQGVPAFSFPGELHIETLRLRKLKILSGEQTSLDVGEIKGRNLNLVGQKLNFDSLKIEAENMQLSAQGQMELRDAYPLTMNLEYVVKPPGYALVQGKGRLSGDLQELRLDTQLGAPIEARLQGTVHELLTTPRWQAKLSAATLPLKIIDAELPNHRFSELRIHGTGSLDEAHLQVQSTVHVHQVPRPLKLSSELRIQAKGMQVQSLRLVEGAAELSGRASLAWEPSLSWDAELGLNHFDPALIAPEWPGDISGAFAASGEKKGEMLSASIRFHELEGKLRGYPLKVAGEASLDGKDVVVQGLHIKSGQSVFKAEGRAGEKVDLSLSLDSPNLKELWPEAQGKLRAKAQLSGARAQPNLNLRLEGAQLVLADTRIDLLRGQAEGVVSMHGPLQGKIQAERIQVGDTKIAAAQLQAQASAAGQTLALNLDDPENALSLQLDGKLVGKEWRGLLRQTQLQSRDLGDWRQEDKGAAVLLAEDRVELERFCVKVKSGNICLGGNWKKSDGLWRTQGNFKALPLDMLRPLLPEQGWELEGRADGSFQVEGKDSRLLRAELAARGLDMRMALPLSETYTHRLQWRTNNLEASYQQEKLHFSLNSELEDNSFVRLQGSIPRIQLPNPNLEAATIEAKAELQLKDIAFLSALSDQQVQFSGGLGGQIGLSGPLARPQVDGAIELLAGKALIPRLGIELAPLHLTVQGKEGKIALKAQGHSGKGRIEAATAFTLADPLGSLEPLRITGERFLALKQPGMELEASPDLTLTLKDRRLDVFGEVTIPYARIESVAANEGIAPSSDIVILDEDQAAANDKEKIQIYTNIRVKAGEDVRVNAQGLRGKIAGNLHVIDEPGRPLVGNGAFWIEEGSFVVYGKRVKISTGRLLFSGGSLTNPGIEIRSENRERNTKAGVLVHGLLKQPEIRLYSTPYMDDATIIAHLLEDDRAFGGSSREDLGVVGEYAEKFGLGALVPLLQGIKRIAMIDEIKLDTGQQFDSLSLVFGSWLTPDLYISYGQDMLKDGSIFKTRYSVGNGVFVETENSPVTNAADILYEFEH